MTLRELIKQNEGYRDKPYMCTAGKLTIGYGHNLDEHGINKQVAEMLLGEDIQRAYYGILDLFPYFYLYSENRQNALIDMSFNLGKTRFSKFKKMIQAVKDEDWDEAALQAEDSKWFAQVGDRAKRNVISLKEG